MGVRSFAPFVAALAALSGQALADTFKAPSVGHPTIQSAVNAAGIGDTVVVHKGDHDETVTVTGKIDLTIRGTKGASLRGLVVAGGSGCRIRSLALTQGTDGIVATGAVDLWILKCLVQDMSGNGISLDDCTAPVVLGCFITGIGGDGIRDDASDAPILQKNRVEECGGDAFDLSTLNASPNGSNGAWVARNRIANCGGGIAFGGDYVVVEKNRMEGLASRGIFVDGGSDTDLASIEKNRISHEGGVLPAIDFDGGNIDVYKNVVVNGRILESGSQNDVRFNRVSGADTGIFSGGMFAFLHGNTVRECDLGIRVAGPWGTLWASKVFDCDDGIVVTGGGVLTTGNRVVRAAGIGFFVTGTGHNFNNDACKGSGIVDLADTNAEGVNEYNDCRFGEIQYNAPD